MTTAPVLRPVCSPDSGSCTVRLSGELDLDSVSQIEPALAVLAAHSRHELVIDLTDVTFCDASGINLFLRLHRQCAAHTIRLRLRGIQRGPGRVLRTFALHRLIPCTFR